MDAGYISRVPIKEGGRFLGYDYTVSDSPRSTDTDKPERISRNGSSATVNPSERSTPSEELLKKEEFPQDSQPLILATLLLTEHRKHDAKFIIDKDKERATLQRWAKDIEKLIRIDHRAPDEILRVIMWCQSPGCFWAANILSGAKLREKFPNLLAQSKLVNKNGKPVDVPRTVHDPVGDQLKALRREQANAL